MKPSDFRFRSINVLLASMLVLASLAAILIFVSHDFSKLEVDEKSDYSHIRIRRSGNVRTLLFVRDGDTEVTQSRVNLDAPFKLMSPYARAMFASYLFKPQQDRVLIVGLGGGVMVHFLKHHEPDLRVAVVEIDPAVVSLAERYFDMRPGGNVDIITDDVFDFLQNTQERYDVVYMDAFLTPSGDTDGAGVPRRLKTIAFYQSILSKLTPDGLVVFNLNIHDDTEEDMAAIDEAFLQKAVFRCPPSGNLVVIGSMTGMPRESAVLESRAKELDERFKAGFSFQKILNDRAAMGEIIAELRGRKRE